MEMRNHNLLLIQIPFQHQLPVSVNADDIMISIKKKPSTTSETGSELRKKPGM
jgi:hypothetical protein